MREREAVGNEEISSELFCDSDLSSEILLKVHKYFRFAFVTCSECAVKRPFVKAINDVGCGKDCGFVFVSMKARLYVMVAVINNCY